MKASVESKKTLRAAMARVLALMAAAVAGVALWLSMRLCQGAARPLLSASPEWLALAANAAIEEGLRLALALAAATAIRRLRLDAGTASLAVVSSYVVASLESAAYIAAFPTMDAYWRLGYALPIHVGAAMLYALATSAPHRGPRTRRAIALAASFAAAWAWHSTFNLVAALAPIKALPLIGTALNVAALAALVIASAIRFGYWSIYETRRI